MQAVIEFLAHLIAGLAAAVLIQFGVPVRSAPARARPRPPSVMRIDSPCPSRPSIQGGAGLDTRRC